MDQKNHISSKRQWDFGYIENCERTGMDCLERGSSRGDEIETLEILRRPRLWDVLNRKSTVLTLDLSSENQWYEYNLIVGKYSGEVQEGRNW